MPVYRWMPPEDIAPVDRLLDATVTPRRGRADLHQRARPPPPCCPAPRTAGCCPSCSPPSTTTCCPPASARSPRCRCRPRGIDTVQPERFRLGPLVQLLCQELPSRARTLPIAGHRVEIRGHAVLVDDELRPVPPAGMSLLRALSRRPGWVVARADLLRALPGAGRDEHAVETAMARLRTALGAPKLIQTVVKRGYRLALDPAAGRQVRGRLTPAPAVARPYSTSARASRPNATDVQHRPHDVPGHPRVLEPLAHRGRIGHRRRIPGVHELVVQRDVEDDGDQERQRVQRRMPRTPSTADTVRAPRNCQAETAVSSSAPLKLSEEHRVLDDVVDVLHDLDVVAVVAAGQRRHHVVAYT